MERCVTLFIGTQRVEKKVAESSAEAELYALCTSFKTARNFRLLIHETTTTEVIMNMRCDKMAALAMIDEPSWRD